MDVADWFPYNKEKNEGGEEVEIPFITDIKNNIEYAKNVNKEHTEEFGDVITVDTLGQGVEAIGKYAFSNKAYTIDLSVQCKKEKYMERNMLIALYQVWLIMDCPQNIKIKNINNYI